MFKGKLYIDGSPSDWFFVSTPLFNGPLQNSCYIMSVLKFLIELSDDSAQ